MSRELIWKIGDVGYFINWKKWTPISATIKTITPEYVTISTVETPVILYNVYTYEERHSSYSIY